MLLHTRRSSRPNVDGPWASLFWPHFSDLNLWPHDLEKSLCW